MTKHGLPRYKVDDDSGCWVWQLSTNERGYGWIRRGKQTLLAHRVWYEDHVGPIPDGLCVLHECDNPPCVNPAHLFLGTRVDNSIDMDAKGRRKTVRGEQNGKAILTADQIPAIRKMYADGMSPRAIGERVGVHGSTIRMVVKGLTWGHVR